MVACTDVLLTITCDLSLLMTRLYTYSSARELEPSNPATDRHRTGCLTSPLSALWLVRQRCSLSLLTHRGQRKYFEQTKRHKGWCYSICVCLLACPLRQIHVCWRPHFTELATFILICASASESSFRPHTAPVVLCYFQIKSNTILLCALKLTRELASFVCHT